MFKLPLASFASVSRKRPRWASRFLLGATLAGLGGGIAIFAQEPQPKAKAQAEESAVGLNGIIGEPASPELDTEFLAEELPETWKAWAESLDEDMLVYMFPEDLDLKGQRELIARMQKRVATMRRAIADPRFQPIHDRLISLAEPLDRHLTLSTAILDSLEQGVAPVSKEGRQQAFQELRDTALALNQTLSQRPDGADWNKDFDISSLSAKLADMNTPVEELKEQLEKIFTKLEDREEYSADQLRFLRGDAFWNFQRAAAKIQAILEWEETPATDETLRETLQELAFAYVSLDVDHLVEYAQGLQTAWDKLVLLHPGNAEKFAFIMQQSFADNLHSYVSEEVMQEAVYDQRSESGQICETVMGAQVYGNRVTDTEVTLNLIESPTEALMAVNLKGVINASTVGEKSCIKVYTLGNSQFWAVKQSHFDGFRFQPYPAEIAVSANSSPYDARTPISCLPILGSCLDNFVVNQAIARKGESEAIARQRVANKVVPELNQGINDSLADANSELTNNTYRRLSKNNLYPVAMRTATTETHLLTHTTIRNRTELGGARAPVIFNEPTGANLHVHESLLNNVADRMNLAGRTMTDDEVREEISRFLTDLTGREFNLKKSEPMPPAPTNEPPAEPMGKTARDKFIFDKTTPIRFQIRDNEVRMTIRTALLRTNGETIPPHDIMIPFQFRFEGEEIIIAKGELEVVQAGGGGSPAQNLVMRNKIRESLPDGRRSRLLVMNLPKEKTLTLRTERIKALNGWFSLWALPTESEPVPVTAPTTSN